MTSCRKSAAFLELTVAVLGLLVTSLASAPAQADDPQDAQLHFLRAVQLYEEQAYPEALTEFERAYASAPNYRVLFNIAQVHFQLNQCAEAQHAFLRYLHEGGAHIPESRRRYVEAELASLRSRIGSLTVITDVPGARVTLDDVTVGSTPVHDVAINPGEHVLHVELSGRVPHRQSLTVRAGQVHELRLDLERTEQHAQRPVVAPDAPAVSALDRRRQLRTARWVLGSSALLLGVGTAASAVIAYRAARKVDDELLRVPADRSRVEQARARARGAAVSADVLGTATLGTAVALTVLWLSTRRTPGDASERAGSGHTRNPGAQVALGPGSLGVQLSF